MWVTVLVSQPSVSIDTETTQRICSPRRPGRPTVFITSRSNARLAGFALRGAGAFAGRELALELLDLGTGGVEATEKCVLTEGAHVVAGERGRTFLSPDLRLQLAEERAGRAEFIPRRVARFLQQSAAETTAAASTARSPRKKKGAVTTTTPETTSPEAGSSNAPNKYVVAEYGGTRGRDAREQRLKIRKSWVLGGKIALDAGIDVCRPLWRVDVTLAWHDDGAPHSCERKMTRYVEEMLAQQRHHASLFPHLRQATRATAAAFSMPDMQTSGAEALAKCAPQIEVEIECVDPRFHVAHVRDLRATVQEMYDMALRLNAPL